MSVDALVPAGAEGESESHAWLQMLLRSAMEQVMASEGRAIQKANSLARLAGLYLKTCQAAELKQAQKQLAARVAKLEEALASLMTVNDERSSAMEKLERSSGRPGGANPLVTPPPAPARSHPPIEIALAPLAAGCDSGTREAHPPARASGHHRRR